MVPDRHKVAAMPKNYHQPLTKCLSILDATIEFVKFNSDFSNNNKKKHRLKSVIFLNV